ncbi:hypothetical protein L1987_62429 [Smallanthus sonchifolius]|uniref:Uncharacterized protein n=1 Tax=Smallanthus sonchifolius TaxID=185202 RepID=A0ACB9CAF0_9ASTR|nr:hypothetical protein L1987_62429 [Smallanthus sonchifolius]
MQRLITSTFVTLSVVPTLASASRFITIDSYSTTASTDVSDLFDQSWVRNLCPKISSISFKMEMTDQKTSLSLKIPYEGLSVDLDIPGLEKDDMRVSCADQQNTMANIMKDGMLNVTLHNQEEFRTNIMATIISNILTTFHDITHKRSWPYNDMFSNRSILGNGLCPAISMLSPVNSFSICKEETSKHIEINMCMPGLEHMKTTTKGLRVSLNMAGVEREGVKTFFDYDTFFIEGKTKKRHYITGIHLPEGIHKNHNMIKRQMEDGGEFYAFLPFYVTS